MTVRLPKRLAMPWRPIIGYAEGQIVQLGQGDYWRIQRATIEPHHGASTVFLYLEPVDTGEVLNGIGEYAPDRIVDLSEVAQ